MVVYRVGPVPEWRRRGPPLAAAAHGKGGAPGHRALSPDAHPALPGRPILHTAQQAVPGRVDADTCRPEPVRVDLKNNRIHITILIDFNFKYLLKSKTNFISYFSIKYIFKMHSENKKINKIYTY